MIEHLAIKRQSGIRQDTGDGVFEIAVNLVLLLLMLFFLYPFYNCVILAFNDGQDALKPGIYFWPREFTMDNFAKAIKAPGMGSAAFLSVLRTGIGTVLTLLVCSIFSYAISKSRLRFRRLYMVIIMIPMFIGGGMIPSFLLIRNLGLFNNFMVYVLPSMFSTFYAIILLASFRDIPASLEESAMMDGANQFIIFFRIILPVSTPVLAAIGIFTAVGHWNSWMDTMLYTDKNSLNTLAFLFSKVIFQQQYLQALMEGSDNAMAAEIGMKLRGATSTSVMIAAMVLATMPVTIVYPFFQKHFAKGVMIGSLKG
jgi:putative aldouronate transport system permease protein